MKMPRDITISSSLIDTNSTYLFENDMKGELNNGLNAERNKEDVALPLLLPLLPILEREIVDLWSLFPVLESLWWLFPMLCLAQERSLDDVATGRSSDDVGELQRSDS